VTENWIERPAVRDGIRRMLESRSQLIANGEQVIGWKLGFGAPTWLEKFVIPGPLVGFLTASRRYPSGATVPVQGLTAPVAESEIAVQLGADVDDPNRAVEAVSALIPAIELADIDAPLDDLEEVLAGNIFHHAVILGEPDPGRAGGLVADLETHVLCDGEEVDSTRDVEALTGGLAAILTHTATLLGAFGENLRAGEVIIVGAVVPPLQVVPGQEITHHLRPFPPVTVFV
jgi:2-keto-4-pentenoate hydratase